MSARRSFRIRVIDIGEIYMKKVIAIVISVFLFIICAKVTFDLFPKAKSEDEIRAKLTDDYIIRSLTDSTTGDIYIKLDDTKLVIDKKDKDKIHVTLNYIGETKYSVWGDCYNYNVTLFINSVNFRDDIFNLAVTGDVVTYYQSGSREAYMRNITYEVQ